MERHLGLSELSVILLVSAIEGCPLSGVPLYIGSLFGVFLALGTIALAKVLQHY